MNSIVSVEWLKEHIDQPDVVVLDASIKPVTGDASAVGANLRIPSARFFDIKGAFSDPKSELPNTLPSAEGFEQAARALGINQDSTLVVYDFKGIYSSPRAWWMFRVMGHDQVAVLDGGLPAWIQAGLPTEAVGETSISPGNFVANIRPELVRDAHDVVQNLEAQDAIVLDARSQGRFTAQVPEPRKGLKGGHIPHSLNLPYDQVLNAGHFRPKEELKRVFDDLDVGEKPLVFSCGSGITACILYLASEQVNDAPQAVYDGSWSEWGIPERDYPIER